MFKIILIIDKLQVGYLPCLWQNRVQAFVTYIPKILPGLIPGHLSTAGWCTPEK